MMRKEKKAVESHYSWVDAAKFLDCSSIRVNLGSMDMPGSAEDEAKSIGGRIWEVA